MARLEIISTTGRWLSLRDQWDELVSFARGSVYQTTPWLLSLWEFPREDWRSPNSLWSRVDVIKRELAICFVWEGDAPVGIAPFFVHRRIRCGLEIERRLRLLGEGSNHVDFVALPEKAALVGKLVANEILRERLADTIVLRNVPEGSPALNAFLAELSRSGASVHESRRTDRYRTQIPSTFRDFLAGLDPEDRRQYRRASEAAERLGLTIEVASQQGTPIDVAMEATLELHCRRWAAVQRSTHLAIPQRRHHLIQSVKAFHARGWVHLALLKQQSRMVAAWLHFFYPPTRIAYAEQTARDLNFDEFAPGKYLLTATFEHMVKARLTQCDLGGGEEYPYKRQFGRFIAYRTHSLEVTPAARFVRPLGLAVRGLRGVRRVVQRL
ncbi:MAG TPA: GNAT family N-acetyltransferase [bacterium]|nr:GNAT family N-acetyltransferase [bacterium]